MPERQRDPSTEIRVTRRDKPIVILPIDQQLSHGRTLMADLQAHKAPHHHAWPDGSADRRRDGRPAVTLIVSVMP